MLRENDSSRGDYDTRSDHNGRRGANQRLTATNQVVAQLQTGYYGCGSVLKLRMCKAGDDGVGLITILLIMARFGTGSWRISEIS